jgi:hypothetical protein
MTNEGTEKGFRWMNNKEKDINLMARIPNTSEKFMSFDAVSRRMRPFFRAF